MRIHKKRPIAMLIISIVSLLSLSAIIYIVPPTGSFTLLFLPLSFLFLFLLLITLFLFSTATYILHSRMHGVLVAGFGLSLLLFQLNNLTHPLFLALLCGLFLMLELFFTNKK